jgi:hypothetical protein
VVVIVGVVVVVVVIIVVVVRVSSSSSSSNSGSSSSSSSNLTYVPPPAVHLPLLLAVIGRGFGRVYFPTVISFLVVLLDTEEERSSLSHFKMLVNYLPVYAV